MIKVIKPKKGPLHLEDRGKKQTKEDCRDFKKDPAAFIKKMKDAKEKAKSRRIYASDDVKTTLKTLQYNKCCYCERKFIEDEDDAILAVEHYRPKAAVKQNRKDKNEYPGYFWLAYKWDNVFLSCHKCNSTWKSTLFPLVNTINRARSNKDKINLEEPLFINPEKDKPRDHIIFIGAVPKPKDNSERGRVTIKEIGLDRSTLNNLRQDKIIELQALIDIIGRATDHPADLILQNMANEAQVVLGEAVLPSAEFSSMAMDFLGI
ncbi:MAG TPA: hypothetical protein VGC97_17700 [Pyrinomonadaceae bacterium]